MNIHIDIQHASNQQIPVSDDRLTHWAELALQTTQQSAELTLRIVDVDEITQLNHLYRKQDKATNVLAFPTAIPDGIALDVPFLGDVIICASVLHDESLALNKSLEAHWALIVIHGVLHLLGYDHIEDSDALIMQTLETRLLAQLGFDNPYPPEDNSIE